MDFSPMELLPTEILQKIISYLPVHDRVRVERVCKRWKNVSSRGVWRDVQVLVIAQFYEDEYDLFHYSLSDEHRFDETYSPHYNELCTKITELGMIQSLVSRAGQHIKEFIFDAFFKSDYIKCVHTPVLSIIDTHCHNIESIYIRHVDNWDIDAFSRLLENNRQLHSIMCCFITENVIKILPLRNWKSLHFVSLNNFGQDQLHCIEKDLWEDKVVELIKNSPSLEKFYISVWTPNILKAISSCEHLEDLFLPIYDRSVTKNLKIYTSLLNRLTCLKMIGRSDGQDDMLIHLLPHCINLGSLHLLYWEKALPDTVLQAMLALPKLEALEVDGPGITEDSLNRLLKFKYLKLTDTEYIEETEILKFIINSECLELLELPGIHYTTDLLEGLVEYAEKDREITLKIIVDALIYEEALEICEGSEIHVFQQLGFLLAEIWHW